MQLTLWQVAGLSFITTPLMLKSDNGQLASYVYVDVAGRDLGSVVKDLQRVIPQQIKMPAGYSLSWSGRYEYLQRATERLKIVVPAALVIIFGLTFLVFRRASEVAIIVLSLPFALIGGLSLIWLLGHAVSVATLIGFIAMFGQPIY